MNMPAMTAQTSRSSSSRQLAVLKATIAKGLNADEFDLFCAYAQAKGLDPIARQVIPVIFNRDSPDKRQMVIITPQDGLRVLASRCGDYGPETEEPQFEIDKSLISPTNPSGLIKCTVTLHKLYRLSSGDTFRPVIGVARWSEYAPITLAAGEYEWIETGEIWPDTGKPKKKKRPIGELIEKLDDSGQWAKMPFNQLAKCARAQALRAGWPEQFSDSHDEAEFDRAKMLDLTASEQVEEELQRRREALIHGGGKGLAYVDQDGVLAFVPLGKYFDVIMTDASNCSTSQELVDMRARNKAGLQDFWAHQKDDALALRKKLDEIARRLVDDGSEA